MPMLADHPYLRLYLLGCALVVPFWVASLTFRWVLAWITKGNIMAANFRKLQPTARTPFWARTGKFIWSVVSEVSLSWVNVIVITWKFVVLLLRVAREALSSAPESIQRLRFPLKTNPDLPVESVWAYVFALSICAGALPPDEKRLEEELDDVSYQVPRFDRSVALRQLEALDVVKPSVMDAVVARGKDRDAT